LVSKIYVYSSYEENIIEATAKIITVKANNLIWRLESNEQGEKSSELS